MKGLFLTSKDQQLARALKLVERRRQLLADIRKAGVPLAERKTEVDRLTASLKMAVDSLLLAYQEEVRKSPWYASAAAKRGADLDTANLPYHDARAAGHHARDIIRAIEIVIAIEDEQQADLRRSTSMLLFTSSLIDLNDLVAARQQVWDRLRLLLYDLLNAGLPMPDIVGNINSADRNEILLGADGDANSHSAWIEDWYIRISGMNVSLHHLVAALRDWLPMIDQAATSPEVVRAASAVAALEQDTLAAGLERLPPALREFAKA